LVKLEIFRGDDKKFLIVVMEKDTGERVDITGSTLVMTWRREHDEAIFFQKTATLTNPVQGEAEVVISSTDTSGLSADKVHRFIFDVEITKTDGSKETIAFGTIIVRPDVTY